MNFRIILGRAIIVVGVIVVLYASVLFVNYLSEEKNAKEFSADAVEQILDEIDDGTDEDDISEEDRESSLQGAGTISIDGNVYIGVLEIPSLNLVLPVQSEWSYTKLRNAPCAYETNPLIIAAHNYDAHFGRIGQLISGDLVMFTTAENQVYYFEVIEVEMLDGTAVMEMVETEYDLTLFTCNYNDNTERVVVRLNIVDFEG